MTDDAKITVTKLDAAKRQLRTAIRLWFADGDPVSIHTLAFAAYEIAHVVSKKRNQARRDLIFDSLRIKDEYRGEWNKAIKRQADFFKHANRDPEGSIEFLPITSLLFMMGAGAGLRLAGEPQHQPLRFGCFFIGRDGSGRPRASSSKIAFRSKTSPN